MSDLCYLRLPKVSGDALIRQARGLREARLLSLQTDPSSFISRYEDEKDQPLQFNIDRINDPVADHFVTMVKPESGDQGQPQDANRYEAFLVMIKEDDTELDNEIVKSFEMAAVYVRPNHRGKGVCTRMVQCAIDWVKEEIQQAGVRKAVINTTAAEVNYSAQRLYSKLGFQVVEHTTHKNKAGEDIPIVAMTFLVG